MSEKQRLMYVNRQPSLWRHSAPAVLITPQDDDDDETISLSPLFLEPLNADFDGDTVALYEIHDDEALQEMLEKAYLKSYVNYDTNRNFLAVLRHEALYAAYILTEKTEAINTIPNEIKSLSELHENMKWYNTCLDHPILFNDEIYTYGICLFNKKCGFNQIVINKTITKKHTNLVSKEIFKFFNYDTKTFYHQIHKLDNFLFMFITMTKHCPSINVNEMADLVSKENRLLFKKLPKQNIIIGYHINEALIDRCIDGFNSNHQLFKLFKSGSRFSKTQLARSCINIGYTADAQNIIVSEPIKGNLLRGITESEFFLGAPGTRKSIRDKSKFTPDSGYLERTLVMALSTLEIVEEDCGGSNFLEFVIFSEKHAETLVGKYYKDPQKPYNDWQILDFHTAKDFINKKIYIRSPMTCTTENFKMCAKCFGERKFSTKYLGIVCGQTISERLTQLVLRTFHTSGAAELNISIIVKEFIKKHLTDIENTSNGQSILHFDTTNIPEAIEKLQSFKATEDNKVYFNPLTEPVNNNDTISMLKSIQNLLKTNKGNIKPPVEFYLELMELVLTVGTPYSSFVEMVFANMFMTHKTQKRFWRYNPDEKIVLKLGDKILAKHLSTLLGLLYQPNKNTIAEMDKLEDLDLDKMDLTIYEKIFLSRL
jgi:hypothetical protein